MSDFLYGKGEIYWKVEKKKDGKFDFANANPCMKRKNRLLNVAQMTHLIESIDYLKKIIKKLLTKSLIYGIIHNVVKVEPCKYRYLVVE